MMNYTSHNVYGANAAMSVNATYINATPSLNIDFANKSSTNSSTWDWGNKLSCLITANELPYFLGVFLGINVTCEGAYHGKNKDKFFKFVKQQDGIFATASTKGQSFNLKISPVDIFHITSKMLPHLKPNFGNMTVDELGRLIKCTIGQYPQ
jgi:hypothetical protein